MTFDTVANIVSAAGISFLLVLIISVAIYYARIGIHLLIARAEISMVKKGGDNAKGVIRLYNCWNRADAFLRAFQACQIGVFSHSSIRDFLPRRKRINNNSVVFWVEFILLFFLLIDSGYADFITSNIPQVNRGLMREVTILIKEHFAICASLLPIIVGSLSSIYRFLCSKMQKKKGMIKDAQKGEINRLIEAHKCIRGYLFQIEKDESHEIEELMKSIESQPSYYIRDAISERIPSISYSYSRNMFTLKGSDFYTFNRMNAAIKMHEKDMREREANLRESIDKVKAVYKTNNSKENYYKMANIGLIDRKVGRAFLKIEGDIAYGLKDCISRVEIMEQTNNAIRDREIDSLSEDALIMYANKTIDKMQTNLYVELIDAIEILVRIRNYINAFDRMYNMTR